jgi:hypothetical protein
VPKVYEIFSIPDLDLLDIHLVFAAEPIEQQRVPANNGHGNEVGNQRP